MHIPDGFLSNPIAFSMDGLSGATILYAARRVRNDVSGRAVPMMGVLAAFVFVAQMLNFPILGGTSGHLVGGALLGILLGPLAGLLTMSTVVVAQALVLQDGGLVALGANIFNIGAVTSFGGYLVFRLLGGNKATGRRLAVSAFLAGWLSMMLSAACSSLELAFSGAIPLRVGFPAMAGFHALIGLVEGGLTAGVITFLFRTRPDLMTGELNSRLGFTDWVAAIVFVAFPVAILVLGGSSRLPDPMQKLLVLAPNQASPAGALLAVGRYADYLLGMGVFAGLLTGVYIASRFARRKAGRT